MVMIGSRTYIRSVPGEFNMDKNRIMELAQQQGYISAGGSVCSQLFAPHAYVYSTAYSVHLLFIYCRNMPHSTSLLVGSFKCQQSLHICHERLEMPHLCLQ